MEKSKLDYHRPGQPTFIIPQTAGFVNRYFAQKIIGGFHHQLFPRSARVYSSLYSSKKLPSSQQLQQATSSTVSCVEWMHSSHFQLIAFIIKLLLWFVIVFAGGGPVRVCVADFHFLVVIPVVARTFNTPHFIHPQIISSNLMRYSSFHILMISCSNSGFSW